MTAAARAVARRSSLRRLLACGAVTAGLLLSAGCSSDSASGEDGSAGGGTAAAAVDGTATEADVAFTRTMVAHSQQMLATTALAADRATDPRVRELSARLDAEARADVETLSGWLSAWDAGAEPTASAPSPGTGLAEASGPAFDALFVERVIEQRSAAMRTAETQAAGGSNPDAVAMAQRLAQSYADEVIELAQLRIELG